MPMRSRIKRNNPAPYIIIIDFRWQKFFARIKRESHVRTYIRQCFGEMREKISRDVQINSVLCASILFCWFGLRVNNNNEQLIKRCTHKKQIQKAIWIERTKKFWQNRNYIACHVQNRKSFLIEYSMEKNFIAVWTGIDKKTWH